VLAPEPLLQLALPVANERGAFRETSKLPEVGRHVLAEACSHLVRGVLTVTTQSVVESTHGHETGTDALHDLVRQILSEAAANEWRPWIKPVVTAEGKRVWRFNDPLPTDPSARLRELVRINRAAQQLIARLSGTAIARWLQLSLFGPESMVAAVSDEG
jgi:hypothetical protein